jgi:hypothetical protein
MAGVKRAGSQNKSILGTWLGCGYGEWRRWPGCPSRGRKKIWKNKEERIREPGGLGGHQS